MASVWMHVDRHSPNWPLTEQTSFLSWEGLEWDVLKTRSYHMYEHINNELDLCVLADAGLDDRSGDKCSMNPIVWCIFTLPVFSIDKPQAWNMVCLRLGIHLASSRISVFIPTYIREIIYPRRHSRIYVIITYSLMLARPNPFMLFRSIMHSRSAIAVMLIIPPFALTCTYTVIENGDVSRIPQGCLPRAEDSVYQGNLLRGMKNVVFNESKKYLSNVL